MTPAALEAFNMSTYLQERGLTVAEIHTELGLLANALYVHMRCSFLLARCTFLRVRDLLIQGLLPESALH